MSKIITALALAAVTSVAAASGSAIAEAKPYKTIHAIKIGHAVKPHAHIVFKPYAHKRYGFYNVGYVAPAVYANGCGFFYNKWQATGAWDWKHKYFVCKGW